MPQHSLSSLPAGAPPDPVRTAERVLTTEGRALLTLAGALPADFAAAVETILTLPGRIACSGIGKSGHVARKIAATLASTGTPAFYIHPAEASHGDLGMIRPGDGCLMLSNSGETREMSDLIAHCIRFEVPIIGMSKAPGSTLMTAATLRLTLPDLPEACAIGMAPTTSTTLAMALGDALAVALMERREVTPDDFRQWHPGGRLGAQLIRVRQLMHGAASVPMVAPDLPVTRAVAEIGAKGFGITGLSGPGGRLAGVITDGDLRRNIDVLPDRTAAQIATPDPVTVTPDMLAAEALAVMTRMKIGVVFVCEDGRPVGMLHVLDCLKAGLG